MNEPGTGDIMKVILVHLLPATYNLQLHHQTNPPSTLSVVPVINSASSEARNR